MATFATRSFTDPLNTEPVPRCDPHPAFDADGFAVADESGERRSWTPLWGGPCTVCGTNC